MVDNNDNNTTSRCGNDVTLNMLAGEVGHRGKVKQWEELGYGLEDRLVPEIAFLQITS